MSTASAQGVGAVAVKPDTGYLNGLRTIAAYWVLIAHCCIWSGHAAWFPDPKLAVCIFMVLSGYVMANSGGDFERPEAWRAFYMRRFFRISPLYYLVLAVVALSPWYGAGYRLWGAFPPSDHVLNPDFSIGNLALHATYLFGLSPKLNVSTMLPDWSLSLEVQFYAVFPLIWLAMKRFGAERVTLVLALVGVTFWAPLRSVYADPSLLPVQINYFLAGILLCQARERPSLAWLAVALCCLEVGHSGRWMLMMPAVAVCIAMLDRAELRPLRKVLDNRAMKAGADLSYGVYLLHGFFIAAAGFLRPSLPTLILWTFVGATAASYLMNRLVERPGVEWGRRASVSRSHIG